MDMIERAMRGGAPPREEPAALSPLAPDSLIERAAAIAKSPPVSIPTPVVASKRTQRSVVLDLERIRALGLLVPDARRSRIKEEYRHIKRPLLMNAAGKGATIAEHANLIMVTSSRPGERNGRQGQIVPLRISSDQDPEHNGRSSSLSERDG
jgi:receptor protein-tyrosine kinase